MSADNNPVIQIDNSEFGKLIDGSQDKFRKHCADKDLGYVMSLRNHIRSVYEVLVKMKDELRDKISQSQVSKDSEEWKTFKGMYVELMKLEEKACVCTEIIKEREMED